MSNQSYKPHILALTAQFVMGNAVVILPFYKSQNAFLAFLLSAIATVVLTLVATFVIKCGAKNKAVFYITSAAIGMLAIYGAATAFYDYLRFVKSTQLPQTYTVLIAIALLAVLVVFALSSNNAIYKYCLLSAAISAIFVILTFVGGIKTFDASQFKIEFDFSPDTLTDTSKIFMRYFSSSAAAVMFVWLTKKKTHPKTVFWGVLTGFAATALCLVQGVFALGMSSEAEYPYIKAVSVISSGSLFTRLDGLAYWILFAAVLVKVAVCVKTVILIIKNIFCKKRTKDC